MRPITHGPSCMCPTHKRLIRPVEIWGQLAHCQSVDHRRRAVEIASRGARPKQCESMRKLILISQRIANPVHAMTAMIWYDITDHSCSRFVKISGSVVVLQKCLHSLSTVSRSPCSLVYLSVDYHVGKGCQMRVSRKNPRCEVHAANLN